MRSARAGEMGREAPLLAPLWKSQRTRESANRGRGGAELQGQGGRRTGDPQCPAVAKRAGMARGGHRLRTSDLPAVQAAAGARQCVCSKSSGQKL